ncbi:MAG: hypothetical protein ACK2T1_00025, partial [Candidatus Promineifilaceae bacterium]
QEPNHENAYSKLVILLILQESKFGAYYRSLLERISFGWNFCIVRGHYIELVTQDHDFQVFVFFRQTADMNQL